MRNLVRTFVTSAACVIVLTVATALTAMADVDQPSQNPTTGQHGSNAGNSCGSPQASVFPGNAASAPGSPFNSSGQAGNVYAGNLGTASTLHANSTAAVSQYDVACLALTTH
jgi:hypothetical protein